MTPIYLVEWADKKPRWFWIAEKNDHIEKHGPYKDKKSVKKAFAQSLEKEWKKIPRGLT